MRDATDRAQEAGTLAEIGRVLFSQDTEVTVRLPPDLAEAARKAWRREDLGAGESGVESPEERRTRHRAGTLALIGLSIEENGVDVDGEVEVRLDAWFVGDALEAADELGMLQEPKGPGSA